MRDRERCPSCGSMLAFKGFDKAGRRVLGCQAAISFYREGEASTMVPCDLSEKRFFIDGVETAHVLWFPKPKFRRE